MPDRSAVNVAVVTDSGNQGKPDEISGKNPTRAGFNNRAVRRSVAALTPWPAPSDEANKVISQDSSQRLTTTGCGSTTNAGFLL
jgi:hypothetical protein